MQCPDARREGEHRGERGLAECARWELTNRRGQPLSSQAIGMLRRNRLYIGLADVTEFGVRDQRGDFDPLVSGRSSP